jgi:xanthine dehydrogenase accessory factor
MSATAKMLVTLDGARIGTVGGGCLEAEIIDRALSAAERGAPAVSEHTLANELAGDYGLTCGGTATIVVEPVHRSPELAACYSACAELLARDGHGVLVTALDWSSGINKALVTADTVYGTATAEMLVAASVLDVGREEPMLRDGMLVEPLRGAPRLVVFGGGHVGGSIGRAAAFAGWRVIIVDDRSEYADAARHPDAERTVASDYAQISPVLGIDEECYVVVATRGHQHDALLVDQLARMRTRYLGMLGSRRKVALTWRLLERWGVPRERLDTVHAPVGVAIGADTPEEIAISVVAEMIAVRREGSRRRGAGTREATERAVDATDDEYVTKTTRADT